MLSTKKAHLYRVGLLISRFNPGDVRWENHFRRLHNRQKLSDWILNFSEHSRQGEILYDFFRRKRNQDQPLELIHISTDCVGLTESRGFQAGCFPLKRTKAKNLAFFNLQRDHLIAIAIGPAASQD